ncbi:MAG: hypothetical protein HYV19_10000 [Gemmatimonadetes bacterium]|nr:hypothetical protein [Gemmatimonadota bacterium]
MRRVWLLLALCASSAQGQRARAVTVRITTVGGQAVPYALVAVNGTPDRIADATGSVTMPLTVRDSVRVSARRIGFRPFDGWAMSGADADHFEARMTPLAALVDTVRIVAQQVTPLSRTGFYERVERVRKSAMLGEFISPEELEARNVPRLSDILQGRQYSRIATVNINGRSQPIAQGRARCSMNVVVDGQLVKGTTQDLNVSEVPKSIRGGRSSSNSAMMLGLDEIVDGRSIMGIEIYPSIAGAPVELIPTASYGGCGLMAIWTGARK